ncbi:hypothetical protein MPSEU_000903700 [Mayamaea pseudoterrestris]|nr:hypothetical protein MPSEU_000903700 [Mayamaea pseudoterrestris]
MRNSSHVPSSRDSGRRRLYVFSMFLLVVVVSLLLKYEDFQPTPREASTSTIVKTAAQVRTATAVPLTRPIRQIAILGERNSGTRWTSDHIAECFNHSVVVTRGLTRYKHWFQYVNASKYKHDTLVLAQFRNPYDWLKAMEHVPHHSPAHLRTTPTASTQSPSAQNDWYTFMTKTWTMPRIGTDLLIKDETTKCQEDFLYRDLVSCNLEPVPRAEYNHTIRYSEHQPFYEMRNDGSGLPYDNILEMRSDKIRNMLSVVNYEGVSDLWVVQYEYLLSKGTDHLLTKIEEWTGLKRQCVPKDPQNRTPKKSRMVSPEFAAHVRQHLNWTVEDFIGYQVESKREEGPKEY